MRCDQNDVNRHLGRQRSTALHKIYTTDIKNSPLNQFDHMHFCLFFFFFFCCIKVQHRTNSTKTNSELLEATFSLTDLKKMYYCQVVLVLNSVFCFINFCEDWENNCKVENSANLFLFLDIFRLSNAKSITVQVEKILSCFKILANVYLKQFS